VPSTFHLIKARLPQFSPFSKYGRRPEALRAKETGREPVILFNLLGHGLLDISAYNGHGNGRAG